MLEVLGAWVIWVDVWHKIHHLFSNACLLQNGSCHSAIYRRQIQGTEKEHCVDDVDICFLRLIIGGPHCLYLVHYHALAGLVHVLSDMAE